MTVCTQDGIRHDTVEVRDGPQKHSYIVAICDVMLTLDSPVVAAENGALNRRWSLEDCTNDPVSCLVCIAGFS